MQCTNNCDCLQIAIEYHLNQHSFVNNQTKKTFPKSYLKYMFGFLFFIWPFLHFFQYINPKVISKYDEYLKYNDRHSLHVIVCFVFCKPSIFLFYATITFFCRTFTSSFSFVSMSRDVRNRLHLHIVCRRCNETFLSTLSR